MKRTLVLVLSGVATAVVVLVGFLLFSQPVALDKDAVSCPIYFGAAAANALPKDHIASRWQIYRFEGEKGTANVKVEASTSSTPARAYSCQLLISRAPDAPGKASDWRIGHIMNPVGFQGKKVRYRVAIKADREMRLDTAQIYAYDGSKVLGAATPLLSPNWQVFETAISVDPAATTFEVWFRLLLDKGTVIPGAGNIYFVPEIEIQAD
jgi:hypothetical protein